MEEPWEFADADTQDHVHGLHLYPARMIPQIADRLIKENSTSGQTVLDPFCGSGSVLAESLVLGRNAVGIDINPLAIIISKAKTSLIPPCVLEEVFGEVSRTARENISNNRRNKYKPNLYYFKNIYHWFNKNVVNDLSIIKESIDKTKASDESIRNLLKVCFSATLLKSSNIAFADNPYFARAKKGKALEKHTPNVLEVFEENLQDYRRRMKLFYELHPKNVSCRVIEHDSRNMPLEDNSIDLIVTSPPYGEESHTMSYSRFAKLSLLWLGFSPRDVNRNQSKSLGGTLSVFRDISPKLRNLYDELAGKDTQRAKEVFSFFWDYKKCLEEMYRVLRSNTLACIVIGDRSASGLKVTNGEITKELGRLCGFNHKVTYHRKIPKKVLPRSDYKVDLINEESIILLEKK